MDIMEFLESKYYNQCLTMLLNYINLLLCLVLLPDGLLRERLRLAESLVQRDDALSEKCN